ncbi:MAG: hypothetical protein QOF51_1787 [Chloroflexota bacterium]|nr:hypothetical protein [Chloroflexota bacterium]
MNVAVRSANGSRLAYSSTTGLVASWPVRRVVLRRSPFWSAASITPRLLMNMSNG